MLQKQLPDPTFLESRIPIGKFLPSREPVAQLLHGAAVITQTAVDLQSRSPRSHSSEDDAHCAAELACACHPVVPCELSENQPSGTGGSGNARLILPTPTGSSQDLVSLPCGLSISRLSVVCDSQSVDLSVATSSVFQTHCAFPQPPRCQKLLFYFLPVP